MLEPEPLGKHVFEFAALALVEGDSGKADAVVDLGFYIFYFPGSQNGVENPVCYVEVV